MDLDSPGVQIAGSGRSGSPPEASRTLQETPRASRSLQERPELIWTLWEPKPVRAMYLELNP